MLNCAVSISDLGKQAKILHGPATVKRLLNGRKVRSPCRNAPRYAPDLRGWAIHFCVNKGAEGRRLICTKLRAQDTPCAASAKPLAKQIGMPTRGRFL